jgi:hypothetical protein
MSILRRLVARLQKAGRSATGELVFPYNEYLYCIPELPADVNPADINRQYPDGERRLCAYRQAVRQYPQRADLHLALVQTRARLALYEVWEYDECIEAHADHLRHGQASSPAQQSVFLIEPQLHGNPGAATSGIHGRWEGRSVTGGAVHRVEMGRTQAFDRLVRSIGCAALIGGCIAISICTLLVVATWLAAAGDRPGLEVDGLDRYPSYLRPLYEDPRRITTLALVIAMAVTVSGLGLVMRREWGRKLTMVMAVTGIIWVIVAIPVAWHSAWLRSARAPADSILSGFGPLLIAVNSLVCIVVLATLSFLVWALRKPEVKSSFH